MPCLQTPSFSCSLQSVWTISGHLLCYLPQLPVMENLESALQGEQHSQNILALFQCMWKNPWGKKKQLFFSWQFLVKSLICSLTRFKCCLFMQDLYQKGFTHRMSPGGMDTDAFLCWSLFSASFFECFLPGAPVPGLWASVQCALRRGRCRMDLTFLGSRSAGVQPPSPSTDLRQFGDPEHWDGLEESWDTLLSSSILPPCEGGG